MRRKSRDSTLFYREVRAICRWSYRYTGIWLLLTLLLTLPAVWQLRNLGLDTDLTRLLPGNSPAVRWSDELKPAVGDGGYFSLIFESDDHDALVRTVDETVSGLRLIPTVETIDYRYPVEFLEQYRYLLIPAPYLESISDLINEWEAEFNPMIIDLGDVGEETNGDGDEDVEEIEWLLAQYGNLTEYHEDADGRMMGIIIRASQGLENLGGVREINIQIQEIASRAAASNDVVWSIGGSLKNRVDEFEVIMEDLRRSGIFSLAAILITLVLSFRSFSVLPVVLLPLATGLVWAFALVPLTVGDLNTITSFLLMVLFGMGVDYSIHLVKRFQQELVKRDPLEALLETFSSTGRSVATSGATTSLGLAILMISDFRGFSDFGIIGGTSMVMVLLAMLFVLPAALTLGYRLGLVKPALSMHPRRWSLVPPWPVTVIVAIVALVSGGFAAAWLGFDYDFTRLSTDVPGSEEHSEKERMVYPGFFGPGAVYLAPDLETLDASLQVMEDARDIQERTLPEPTIGPISSVRDFAPDPPRVERRLALIAEIQEMLGARWVNRIDDPDRKRLIEDILAFTPPETTPSVDEIPVSLRRNLVARDGSGELVMAVNVSARPRDGRMSMAFTRDLYDLGLPEGLRGPTGDKPVMAEILWLVTGEAPLIVFITLLGVYFMVVIDRRSFSQAAWVLLPLVGGLLLTFGVMIALGWKFNFFNIVVLPTMLGIGVDHGIHYYRRWKELERDTRSTQCELFEPLTACTVTTMMGYAGMTLAHHPGLLSIGNLAVAGLACTWLTALVLLPGSLRIRERWVRRHRPELFAIDGGAADDETRTAAGPRC